MKISGKVFDMLKIVLFAALLLLLPHSVFAADDVVYTTEGGTWEQVNSTTWNMDKDGDGETDVTLVKNGDEWQYLFTVLDDKAKYFAWEEPVPDGYEVVGLGDRPNPAISSVAMSMTKYSHTPNISDDGTKNGNYGNSLNLNEVVSIPGAESLHVTIKYGGESASYDWVCMWEGSHPTYTASSNYSSSLTNKLGGGSGNVKEYDVQGDTVTFGFRSDGSGYGDGFGYYAVVSGTAPQQDAVIVNRSTETPPPATGSLSLTKQVAADTPDTEQNFRFDITLTSEDETVQKMLTGMKMYGDVSFTDGQATVYLTHGQTVTMTGIPEGAKYSIVETPVENYEASWSGDGALAGSGDTVAFEGVVAADATAAVTCTNALNQESVVPRETGSLQLRKNVVPENTSDRFSFHTAFWDLEPETEYTFTLSGTSRSFRSDISGSANVDIELGNLEVVTFDALPVGCRYQIMEDASDYVASFEIQDAVSAAQEYKNNQSANQSLITAKEVLDKDELAVVVFTNTAEKVPVSDTTSIHVEKVWNDSDNAAGRRPANIMVQLMQDEDMIATALLDEASNWSADFTDLDVYQEDGVTEYVYSINEVDVPGYQSEVTSADTAAGKTFTITNTAVNIGSLKISKTVQGEGFDPAKAFRFTLEMTKADGSPLTGVYQLDSTEGTKTGSVAFDEQGRTTFTLKADETMVIKDLPSGAAYTVTETPTFGYTEANNGEYSGTISDGITELAAFTNVYSSNHSLSVSKTVKGNQGDKSRDFRFQLSLSGARVPDSLAYTRNGETGTINIVNGVAEFTLAHEETINFDGVPAGITYTVTEVDGVSSGYDVESTNATGTLDEDAEVSFTNTKNVGVPTGGMTNTAAIVVLILICMSAASIVVWKRKEHD